MSSLRPTDPHRRAGHDVIVVGTGVAGAATALLLGRHGVRTLLVDGRRAGPATPPIHALLRGAILQLARWDLLGGIAGSGAPPVRRTTLHHGDATDTISVKPVHGVDALYAPRPAVFERLLLQAAVDAGVDVRRHTSLRELIVADGRVVGARSATGDDHVTELGAALVIGADGIGSTVAHQAGATYSRVAEHVSAVTYGQWAGLDSDGYEWTFRPDACSGAIPNDRGEACVFVSATPARIGGGGTAVLGEILGEGAPELADRLRRADGPRGTRTWHGHRGYIRRSQGRGWALVGEAGSFMDPIGGHGLTDPLRDAELLAMAVVDGLGGRTPLGDALERYETCRDRLAGPRLDIVDRMASHRWDESEVGDLLVQQSSSMAAEVETLAALDPWPM